MFVNLESLPKKKHGFIVFEGVNGSGKSSLIKDLGAALTGEGREVFVTREPGGTALGAALREILQESKVGAVSPLAELLLFSADRVQHIDEVLRPASNKGSLILCDRFYYSTIAFQGFGRGLDMTLVKETCDAAVGGFIPDLVILLDLDASIGLARTKGRGIDDTFESESLAFHSRVRKGFLELAASLPEPFYVIDASRSKEEVFKSALEAVRQVLR